MGKLFKISFIVVSVLFTTSCSNKFLEVVPTTSVTTDQAFESLDGAKLALNGIYRNMYSTTISPTGSAPHDSFGEGAIQIFSDLRADDLILAKNAYGWFSADYNLINRQASNSRPLFVWRYYYAMIANTNEIISKIDAIPSASEEELNNIKGQALAIRAYCYFKLVQLFQFTYLGNEDKPGVPLYTEPSTASTEPRKRSSVRVVYAHILDDLNQSIELLAGNTQSHISHIDEKVVNGLLARVYLVQNKWDKAINHAKKAREKIEISSPDNWVTGFSISGRDKGWLWGLKINEEQITYYASFFSHMDNTYPGYAGLGMQKCINDNVYQHLSNNDVRKSVMSEVVFTDGGNPEDYMIQNNKFVMAVKGTWAADYIMMRAEEMLLIEAESNAMLGNDAIAATILQELISQRDPSVDVTSLTGQILKEEIAMQRRAELWGEGHRLFDLLRKKEDLDRRDGRHNEALAQTLQLPAGSKEWILQIPQEELDINNLIQQND